MDRKCSNVKGESLGIFARSLLRVSIVDEKSLVIFINFLWVIFINKLFVISSDHHFSLVRRSICLFFPWCKHSKTNIKKKNLHHNNKYNVSEYFYLEKSVVCKYVDYHSLIIESFIHWNIESMGFMDWYLNTINYK